MFAHPVPPLVTPRTPVTSAVSETEAQGVTPAPLKERPNWLVDAVPWYSEKEPSAAAIGRAEVIEVTARLVVVAPVVVTLAKMSRPVQVLLSPRSVEEAAVTVMEEPALKVVPLMVPREPVR